MGKRNKKHTPDKRSKKLCTVAGHNRGVLSARAVFQKYKCWDDIPPAIQCREDVAKMAMSRKWVPNIAGLPMQFQQDETFRRRCIIKGFQQRCHAKKTRTYCDSDYKELPEQWKTDREVISAAFKYDRATLKDVPGTVLLDKDFVRQVLLDRPRFFSELPPEIQNDLEYWMSGELTEELLETILYDLPTLRNNRQFWVNLLEKKFEEVEALERLFVQFAPDHIQLDHEIVLNLIDKDPQVFFQDDVISNTLPIFDDETFIRKLFEFLGWHDLDCIPKHFHRLYPQLVVEILIPRALQGIMDEVKVDRFAGRFVEHFAKQFAASLPSELWNDFDIIKAWFSNDGKFMEAIPETWDLDPKIFLWIAENCKEEDIVKSFERAPEALLDDKSFMMQVIRLEPKLYQAASKKLHEDMEMRMLVCSVVSNMDELHHCGMDADDVQHTHAHVQERLKAHQSFETYRSCVSYPAAVGAPITLLNQGPTTAAVAYDSLVHVYLDVPTGKELHLVQKCLQNMTKP
jgi:hypothetical protein